MVVVESSSNYYSVLQHLLPTIGDDNPNFIQNQLYHKATIEEKQNIVRK